MYVCVYVCERERKTRGGARVRHVRVGKQEAAAVTDIGGMHSHEGGIGE